MRWRNTSEHLEHVAGEMKTISPNSAWLIGSYATYSDIFRERYNRPRLENFIRHIPWGAVLNIASQMLTRPIGDHYCQESFLKYLRNSTVPAGVVQHVERRIKNRVLVSHQGLLATAKWLLAFGEEGRFLLPMDKDAAIGAAVYLCLIVSDYLYDADSEQADLKYEMLRNASFHSNDSLAGMAARANRIYGHLARHRDLYDAHEYLDFNRDFETKYGYTIEDYLAVVFGIYAGFGIGPQGIDFDWIRNIQDLFSETALNTAAADVIRDELLLPLSEARAWALTALDAPWDFSLFQRRPLLEVEENLVFPIAPRFLADLLSSGLFQRIRACYPQTDTRFLKFFGRPYEEYIKELALHSVQSSPLPYEFYPEFRYGSGRGKRSPDVLIKLGKRLLAIEAKSLRMRSGGYVHGDPSVMDDDLERLVLRPLKQAHDRVVEIKRSDPRFKDIEEVYLVSVCMGGFPTLAPFENKVRTLTETMEIPVHGYAHLDTTEFEMLCALMARRRPIFPVLENKMRLGSRIPFKNYLISGSLPAKRAAQVTSYADEFADMVLRILFPHYVSGAR